MSAVLEQEQQTAPQVSTDDVILAYIALRDRKDRINADAKAQAAQIDEQLVQLQAWLHNNMLSAGLQSCGSQDGTAFFEDVKFAKVEGGQWDTTLQFIVENKAWHFLKKDINKTAVEEYIGQHGVPPPGINWVVKKEVKVRRK